jgi:hypothetical protein
MVTGIADRARRPLPPQRIVSTTRPGYPGMVLGVYRSRVPATRELGRA